MNKFIKWQHSNTEIKLSDAPGLEDLAFAKMFHLIDDQTVSTKTVWPELARIYTSSSTPAVENLQAKLEASLFDEEVDWEKHVS